MTHRDTSHGLSPGRQVGEDLVQDYKNFRLKMSPGTLVLVKIGFSATTNLSQENLKEIKITYIDPGSVMMFLDTVSGTYNRKITLPLLRIPISRWLTGDRIVYSAFKESDLKVEIL